MFLQNYDVIIYNFVILPVLTRIMECEIEN